MLYMLVLNLKVYYNNLTLYTDDELSYEILEFWFL